MTTLTTEQTAVVNAIVAGDRNVACGALAGTGKTSTILATVDAYVRKDPEAVILVCAFNKPIELEITKKLKERGHNDWRRVSAKTIHAMGLEPIRAAFGQIEIDSQGNKIRNILRDPRDWANEQIFIIRAYEAQITALVGYAKQAGVGFFADAPIADTLTWTTLADHYDINGLEDVSDMDALVAIAQEVYRRSLAITNVIDFNDMILFPLIKNLRVKYPKDVIFVDEAQDLSRARQALIKKFVRPGSGRMHIVGDINQAIYGFSGADAEAMTNLITSLDALELPMTVTWRCPKAVVAEAQKLVPSLQAAPNAAEGTVATISELPADLVDGDAIICRTNAPLLKNAYALIRKGIPCRVEGREIGKGLQALARRWKVTSIDKLLIKLEDYKEREIQKAMAQDNETKAQAIADKVETLVTICNACLEKNQKGVTDVLNACEAMFGDQVSGCVVLCSMHKSKGREWKRVIILVKPIKRQMQAWQRQQEQNLRYVAITRSMETLLYLNIE